VNSSPMTARQPEVPNLIMATQAKSSIRGREMQSAGAT
jgi:hypothetical protein